LEEIQEIVLDKRDEECFDEESLNKMFRAMHTIKGSSGVMMFDNITTISHKLEDVFFYLRESKPQNVPHLELIEHILKVSDFIGGEMYKIQNGSTPDGEISEIMKELDDFLDSIKGDKQEKENIIKENIHKEPQQFYIAPMATSASKFYKIDLTYNPELSLINVHAYKLVYALKDIAEKILHYPQDIISDTNSGEKILKDGFKILLQTQSSEEDLRNIIKEGYDIKKVEIHQCSDEEFMQEIRTEEQPNKSGGMAPGDFVVESKGPGKELKLAKDREVRKSAFISVDIKKMDLIMDLMEKLVVAEDEVLENEDLKASGVKLDNFNKAAERMSNISKDLQSAIISMRMVSLSNTFKKMNRIVFDVSRKLGKDIEFEMIGENTEVDKNIIDNISDPLMHLVRNAVDHGIESNEERIANGKIEKGKVTLSASIEDGEVVISVKDNGKGIDRNKIIEKARNKGLLDNSKLDSAYTDEEVYNFITFPGFSTNEQITEYSGRGVGMDVVVSNLKEIGGSLDIKSTFGKGSLMTLRIPLKMAVIDGNIVRLGGDN
jgi:two-component system chemotaxis sensor kinase CheA